MSPEYKKPQKPQEHKMKISLKEMPKISKKSGLTKKVVKPPKTAPPMPKGQQLKKIVKPAKKPNIKYDKKKIDAKPKVKKPPINKPLEKPKPKKKVEKVKPLPPIKPYIPLKKKKEEKQKKADPLSWMSEDKSKEDDKKEEKKKKYSRSSSVAQNIKKLYGEEFGKLSPGQQKYIIDNQEIMRRITQQVLTRVAGVNLPRDMNVNRTNVIEFYLHPNGDMSDFRFIKKSGYYVLDDTTKETIEYAYSKYPLPKEKTLIRYNVFYNLARY